MLEFESETEEQRQARSSAGITLDPRNPLESARQYVSLDHTTSGKSTIIFFEGEFHRFTGKHWIKISESSIRSWVWLFLGKATTKDGEPFKPTTAAVSNIVDALKAIALINTERRAPFWFDGRQSPSPSDLIVCENGILDLTNNEIIPHTPDLFAVNALPFGYHPNGPRPERFIAFLEQLFPGDELSKNAFWEFAGYALSPLTNLQKMLLIVGPSRSGKGTIARILTRLLGQENVVGPTLNGLATNFGLQPLIGKLLAIIGDARLGNKSDQHLILERLLSIVGEDSVVIDRKFGEPWSGRLPTRFVVLTNELPRLPDSSGAFAARAIVLRLTESFKGKEDPGLTEALLAELPQLFAWAVEGRRRLMERGYFIQPDSGRELLEELEDLGSPVSVFIRDYCEVGPQHESPCEEVYHAWVKWCEQNGRGHPGNVQTLGRDLRSALPSLQLANRRQGDRRHRVYSGISVRQSPDELPFKASHGNQDDE